MSISGSEGSNQATLYLSLPRGTHLREPQGGTGAQDSLRRVLGEQRLRAVFYLLIMLPACLMHGLCGFCVKSSVCQPVILCYFEVFQPSLRSLKTILWWSFMWVLTSCMGRRGGLGREGEANKAIFLHCYRVAVKLVREDDTVDTCI